MDSVFGAASTSATLRRASSPTGLGAGAVAGQQESLARNALLDSSGGSEHVNAFNTSSSSSSRASTAGGKQHTLFLSTLPLTVRSSEPGVPTTTTAVIQSQIRIQLAPAAGGNKLLQLAITDPDDPLFLYSLMIAEHDYMTLKQEQGLVVDFHVFPDKLVELIEQCKQDDVARIQQKGRAAEGRLMAQLSINDGSATTAVGPHRARFSIMETNTFRHITHLSLLFTRANDAVLKRYLAGVIDDLKSELQASQNSATAATRQYEKQLTERVAQVDSLELEIKQLRAAHVAEVDSIRKQALADSSKERDKVVAEREVTRREHDKEMRELEQKLQDEIKSISLKLLSAESSQSHLQTHAKQVETQLEHLQETHTRLSEEHARLQSTHASLLSRAQQHERDSARLQAEVTRLEDSRRKLEASQQELQQEVRDAQRELTAERAHRTDVEKQLKTVETQNATLESSMQQCTAEIAKGNEIIARLQSDLKQTKTKAKLKAIVTVQQEKLLDERVEMLKQLRAEVDKQAADIAKFEEQMKAKDDKVSSLQKSNDELKKTAEENARVIEWLHRQLNDDVVGARGRGRLGGATVGVGGLSLDWDGELAALEQQYGLNGLSKENRELSPTRSRSPTRFRTSTTTAAAAVNLVPSPEPSKRARAYLESITTTRSNADVPPRTSTTSPLKQHNYTTTTTFATAQQQPSLPSTRIPGRYNAALLDSSSSKKKSDSTATGQAPSLAKKHAVRSNYF
ncbi:hypothetical protein RI367_003773 [Sorochytrium milnesiophthora]